MGSYVLETSRKQHAEEVLAEKSHSFVENLITKLGLSDEQAADVAEVSPFFVKKVRKELQARDH